MRRTLIASALLLAPLPALAQPAAAPAPAPAIEPARAAAAARVAKRLLPEGTYQRMMGTTLDKLIEPMMDSMLDMPMSLIARMGGLDEEQAAALDQAKISEIMAIYDPHFRERTQRGMRAMMDSMTGLMTQMEPRVRNGLGRAYARKFSTAQLEELDRFFATPTGSLYASESMMMFVDPELMTEMQALMPEMMKRMPDFVKAAEAATADLPKPRKISDLSPAERDKLARLLGVKPADLREPDKAPSDEETGE